MGKKTSIGLGLGGVVLIVFAIVWWAAIAPALTKLPSDIDVKMDFDGALTQYVDAATGQALPAGQEKAVSLTVVRTFASVADLYTSGVAVCDDTIVMSMGGKEGPPQVTRYALDRSTRKCVDSPENWAYSSVITLPGRVGNYGPLFPGGLKVGDTLTAFFNDPAKAFDVKVAERIENFHELGITALKIDATRPAAEYYGPIAQAVLASQGLPMEITFEQLGAQMKAMGLDLESLLAALATVATPEDMQALQAIIGQPVGLIYTQESGDVIYIEEKTGATVGATFDRTTNMQIDTSGLIGAFAIIGKYASDSTVGPAITALMQSATQLGNMAPTKVFNQNMSIIASSEESLAKEAESKASLLGMAKIWIPLIILIVGLLVLLVGVLVFSRAGKGRVAVS